VREHRGGDDQIEIIVRVGKFEIFRRDLATCVVASSANVDACEAEIWQASFDVVFAPSQQGLLDIEAFVTARQSQFPGEGKRQSSAAATDLQDMVARSKVAEFGNFLDHSDAAAAKQVSIRERADRNAQALRRQTTKLRQRRNSSPEGAIQPRVAPCARPQGLRR
jgi:hypothetical protein